MQGKNQKSRFSILGFAFLSSIVLAAFSQSEAYATYGHNAPRLEAAYAAEALGPGDIWEVFIKGTDPDGDLQFIHLWIDIPGAPTTPIRLMVDKNQRNALSGYLFLNSLEFGGRLSDLFGIPFQLWVTLEDRAGHRSETVELPFSFYFGAKQSTPPEGVFEKRFLGRIPGIFLLPNGGGP